MNATKKISDWKEWVAGQPGTHVYCLHLEEDGDDQTVVVMVSRLVGDWPSDVMHLECRTERALRRVVAEVEAAGITLRGEDDVETISDELSE